MSKSVCLTPALAALRGNFTAYDNDGHKAALRFRQPPVGNAVRGFIKLHRGSDRLAAACSYGATTRSSSACSFEKQSESRSPSSNGIPSSAVPASSSSLRSGMPTLENAAYLIPPGISVLLMLRLLIPPLLAISYCKGRLSTQIGDLFSCFCVNFSLLFANSVKKIARVNYFY